MLRWRGQKSLNGFKSGTFIGRFPNDGAAGMVVKGLKYNHIHLGLGWSVSVLAVIEEEKKKKQKKQKKKEEEKEEKNRGEKNVIEPVSIQFYRFRQFYHMDADILNNVDIANGIIFTLFNAVLFTINSLNNFWHVRMDLRQSRHLVPKSESLPTSSPARCGWRHSRWSSNTCGGCGCTRSRGRYPGNVRWYMVNCEKFAHSSEWYIAIRDFRTFQQLTLSSSFSFRLKP